MVLWLCLIQIVGFSLVGLGFLPPFGPGEHLIFQDVGDKQGIPIGGENREQRPMFNGFGPGMGLGRTLPEGFSRVEPPFFGGTAAPFFLLALRALSEKAS